VGVMFTSSIDGGFGGGGGNVAKELIDKINAKINNSINKYFFISGLFKPILFILYLNFIIEDFRKCIFSASILFSTKYLKKDGGYYRVNLLKN